MDFSPQAYPPIAWRLPPERIAQFAEYGWPCETRRCREPAVIATHRWYQSKSAGRVLLAEHFYCEAHGQAFAQRYHIVVQPAPPEGDDG